MLQWVRLCASHEAPLEGQLMAVETSAAPLCLARVAGCLRAVDDVCPHRQAPLHEGWIEDGKLVCPWHSWTFDMTTGAADFPEGECVRAFALKEEDGQVLAEVDAE